MLESPGPSPLVGRGTDLARLRDACGLDPDKSPGGHAARGLVLLSGDAGIGKTRLLTELTHRAREAGRDVLLGHCLGEGGRDLPYLPFTEMLGRLFDAEPERVNGLVGAHPALRRLVPRHGVGPSEPPSSPGSPGDPGATGGRVGRGDLVEAVHGGLELLARTRPLLVVVEDVHWADPSTQELLTVLFTRGFAGPVSLVVSYRTDDLHRRHPLRPTLVHWMRLGSVARLELGPLPDDAMRVLVRGLGPADEDSLERVVARAEGNAFFAEELAAAGDLPLSVPGGDLGRLLLLRVENLDEAAMRVVRLACVSGRTVGHALLSAVAGLPDSELDAALRSAVERGILVPTSSTQVPAYAFRHALLGECLYDDLLPGERTRFHAAYTAALSADPSLGSAATLARHAAAVGDRETTIDASLCAGRVALDMGGPEEALAHAERALELLSPDDARAHAATMAAGRAATAAGRALRALDLFADRLGALGGLDNPCPTHAAHERAEFLGEYAVTARLTDADVDRLALVERALAILPPGDDTDLRARLEVALAQVLYDRGESTRADDLVSAVVTAAGAAGRGTIAAEALTMRARYVDLHGVGDDAGIELERIIAEGVADLPTMLRAYHHLGAHHLRMGEFASAMEAFGAGRDAAVSAGRPWAPYALECRGLYAVAAYEHGDWEAALTCSADTAGAPEPGRSFLVATALTVAAGRGETDALACLDAVRRWWPHEGQVVVTSAAAAIELLARRGDVDAAVDVHRQAVAELARLWGDPDPQAGIRLAGVLLGRLADHVSAATPQTGAQWIARADELLAAADRAATWMSCRDRNGLEAGAWAARARAEALLLRARAAETGGGADTQALVVAWREAVAAFTAYPNVYELARCRTRLAGVLAGDPTRRDGHRIEAAELLDAACETADRLDARAARSEIDAVRREWGLPGPPASRVAETASDAAARTPGELTPRELEVIRLLAEGRTNGQIGRALFISTKTASVHVSNILAKLGVATRGEAAAYAHRAGLLDPSL